MADYASFRQRLDTVLRTRDVKQVSEFLIAEGQWDEGTPADPAFGMWMMIATSPALQDLQPQALQWLASNGHEAEASAFMSKNKEKAPQQGRQTPKQASGRKPASPPQGQRPRQPGNARRDRY